jgi:5-carboxyvanillate decarboxylase
MCTMSMNRREFLEASSVLLPASLLDAGAATTSEGVGLPQAANRKYRLIDTEVHFSTPEHSEALRRAATALPHWDMGNGAYRPSWLDVEDGGRIKVMDKMGVDFAVLSLTAPGVQTLNADTATSVAASTNDYLAAAIKKYPTRLAGFATFAPQDPQKAAKEIDRAVNQLKLNALLVNSHTNGEYLDDKKFWPILEAAQAVNTPLYIHPRTVPESASSVLHDTPYSLSQAPWGYPTETSLHALRLIANGIFEQFPNLKIVLGHMGEGLPFWRYRIDYWSRYKDLKKPSEYFRTNFMITTSGMNSHPALKYCHKVLGPDQIMWASDYPYQPEMNEAAEFMNTAPLPAADVEKIAHGNAERYFRLPTA